MNESERPGPAMPTFDRNCWFIGSKRRLVSEHQARTGQEWAQDAEVNSLSSADLAKTDESSGWGNFGVRHQTHGHGYG